MLIATVAAVIVATGIGIVGPVSPGGAATAGQLTRYPYLTDLVGTTVTMNWASDRSAATGSAQWGSVAANGTCAVNHVVPTSKVAITVNGVAEYQWKATTTLPVAGTYCYRVFLGNTDLLGSDPSPRFATQVPAGASAPFSFAVFGDWGLTDASGDNPNQTNLFNQLASSGVRFAVTVGDNGYPNGDQTNYGDLGQHGANVSAIFGPSFWAVPGRSIPLFPAAGNHGLSGGSSHTDLTNWPQDVAVSSSGGRYVGDTYCCVNGTRSANYASSWYAFDAGPARLYVLTAAWGDTNAGNADVYADDYAAHWTPSSPEYKWLAADLAAHPGGLKFAFFHYPLYADQASQSSDTSLQGPNRLEGLLASQGVGIVFNGHAHIYERNLPSRPGYPVDYVTGGGGGTLESVSHCSTFDAYAIGWSPTSGHGSRCGAAPVPDAASRVFHYIKVTVNGTTVTVAPTDELGRTFDVQTYTPTGASPAPSAASNSAGYVVDGLGALHSVTTGSASPLAAPRGGPHWSFNIARGVAMLPDHTGGYVLDGYGGLHPFAVGNNPMPPATHGGATWSGWDIARGVAVNPNGRGGYVVDGYGGLHPFAIGAHILPTTPTDAPSWPGRNIVRGIALLPNGGGYTVDGSGRLYPFTANAGTAPAVRGGPFWNGFDIARGVAMTPDGSAGIVLDGFGGAHGFAITGTPPPAHTTASWNGFDIARGIAL